jgi:hypothetical protein
MLDDYDTFVKKIKHKEGYRVMVEEGSWSLIETPIRYNLIGLAERFE